MALLLIRGSGAPAQNSLQNCADLSKTECATLIYSMDPEGWSDTCGSENVPTGCLEAIETCLEDPVFRKGFDAATTLETFKKKINVFSICVILSGE
jgi:hypothetical protein